MLQLGANPVIPPPIHNPQVGLRVAVAEPATEEAMDQATLTKINPPDYRGKRVREPVDIPVQEVVTAVEEPARAAMRVALPLRMNLN